MSFAICLCLSSPVGVAEGPRSHDSDGHGDAGQRRVWWGRQAGGQAGGQGGGSGGGGGGGRSLRVSGRCQGQRLAEAHGAPAAGVER